MRRGEVDVVGADGNRASLDEVAIGVGKRVVEVQDRQLLVHRSHHIRLSLAMRRCDDMVRPCSTIPSSSTSASASPISRRRWTGRQACRRHLGVGAGSADVGVASRFRADVVLQLAVTYSIEGPVHLELLQGPAGSIWDGHDVPGAHHFGYWSDDVGADTESLLADGWTLELRCGSAGRRLRPVHLRSLAIRLSRRAGVDRRQAALRAVVGGRLAHRSRLVVPSSPAHVRPL